MRVDVEELYERYGPMVLRRCRFLLRDDERALDAMQETFARLLRHRQRLLVHSPSALLLRMATNVCLNDIRSTRRRPEHGDSLLFEIAIADEAENRSLAHSILSRLFASHPESTRTMAVMRWVDGMTLEEVASELGMSVSGVRKRLDGLRTSGAILSKEKAA